MAIAEQMTEDEYAAIPLLSEMKINELSPGLYKFKNENNITKSEMETTGIYFEVEVSPDKIMNEKYGEIHQQKINLKMCKILEDE